MSELGWFLLVFDRSIGHLAREEYYTDRDKALIEFASMQASHLLDTHLEIVLLAAESRDDLLRTHGYYFEVKEIDSAGRLELAYHR